MKRKYRLQNMVSIAPYKHQASFSIFFLFSFFFWWKKKSIRNSSHKLSLGNKNKTIHTDSLGRRFKHKKRKNSDITFPYLELYYRSLCHPATFKIPSTIWSLSQWIKTFLYYHMWAKMSPIWNYLRICSCFKLDFIKIEFQWKTRFGENWVIGNQTLKF